MEIDSLIFEYLLTVNKHERNFGEDSSALKLHHGCQFYKFNKITELYILRMSRFYGMLIIPQ